MWWLYRTFGLAPILNCFAPPSQLASKQLVGMLLVLIVKKRLRPNFSDVRTASVGAGIMGLMVGFYFSMR